MQFGKAFAAYFKEQGNDVIFDLYDPGIDIILLTDPRRSSSSSTFTDADIAYYLTNVNSQAIVVQRVNDNSSSRDSDFRSRRLAFANHCAHQTVFVSNWLQEDYERDGFSLIEPVVIHNGADRAVFHGVGGRIWDGNEKLRVVTHHWSTNWKKGFDVYREIDVLLNQQRYRELFDFTFVGRVPSNVQFRNTRVVAPLCGLPVLYRRSGSLPEYCSTFGLPFNEGEVGVGLFSAYERYSELKANMSEYPYDTERCCGSYDSLFRQLLTKRDEVVNRRRWTQLNGWIFRSCSRICDLVIRGYDRFAA